VGIYIDLHPRGLVPNKANDVLTMVSDRKK